MGNKTGGAGIKLEAQSPSPPLDVIVQFPPAVGCGPGPENTTWTCCSPGGQKCSWQSGLIRSEKAYAG